VWRTIAGKGLPLTLHKTPSNPHGLLGGSVATSNKCTFAHPKRGPHKKNLYATPMSYTKAQGCCRVLGNKIPKEGPKASQRRSTNWVAHLPSNSVFPKGLPGTTRQADQPAHRTNTHRATQRGGATKQPTRQATQQGGTADQPARQATQRVEATDQPNRRATQRGRIADQPAHRATQQDDNQLLGEHRY
jgi:hypothetical protein